MFDPQTARRLLVYGGSFDPPHRAHLSLPFHAADAVDADGVLYVPSGRPPHKRDRRLTPGEHRLEMLRLGLGETPGAAIEMHELQTPGPHYTVETLERLRDRLPRSVEMRLLIGADMAAIFYEWKNPHRILELAEPLVMLRPPNETVDDLLAKLPDDLPDDQGLPWAKRVVNVPQMDVSSTRLRQLLSEGRYDDRCVHEALPEAILDYIRAHELYR